MGCVLYQLACLHPPFTGENIMALNNSIIHKGYKPLPHIYSAAFVKLVDSLLEKKPERRLDVKEALGLIPEAIKVQYELRELQIERDS